MPNCVVAIAACLLGAAPFACFATHAGEAPAVPAAPYAPCSLVDPDARHPGDAVWVDTRSAAEFRRYWIPGSINVPLYAIKTTSLIKNRRIVMIVDDYGVAELQSECVMLASAGVEAVSILRGGLDAWRRGGGELDGDPPPLSPVQVISPRAFYARRHDHAWLIVNTSTSPLVRTHFPHSISISHPNDTPERFGSALIAAVEASGLKAPFVLLVGRNDEWIRRALARPDPPQTFFLQGGINDYDEYVSHQHAMWSKRGNEVAKLECEAVH